MKYHRIRFVYILFRFDIHNPHRLMRSYLSIFMILLLFSTYYIYILLTSIVGCRWCLLIIYYFGLSLTPNWELLTSFPYVHISTFYMHFIWNNFQIWNSHGSDYNDILFWIDCMAFVSRIFVFLFLTCSTSIKLNLIGFFLLYNLYSDTVYMAWWKKRMWYVRIKKFRH